METSGKDVFIKRVDMHAHPDEVKIAVRLGSPANQEDGRNHCVPILDIFEDEDATYRYIVMPVLRPFNEPKFVWGVEVIDFVNQVLEVISPSFHSHRQHLSYHR